MYNMNPLLYLASRKQIAEIAMKHDKLNWKAPDNLDEPFITIEWLKYFGGLHYDLCGRFEEPFDIFEPNAYIAGYPGTIHGFWDSNSKSLNYDLVYFAYIVYGIPNNLEKNLFSIPSDIAYNHLHICSLIQNKRILVFGNSPSFPKETQNFIIRENDVVVRFNKAINLKKRTDLLVVNNVLIENKTLSKYLVKCPIVCMQHHTDAINLVVRHNIHTDYALTSGVLFLLWLAYQTNTIYESVHIAGFDMGSPGEKAHYFDNETIPSPGRKFPGHDSNLEKKIIQDVLSHHELKCFRI